jgi:hypothetical protein
LTAAEDLWLEQLSCCRCCRPAGKSGERGGAERARALPDPLHIGRDPNFAPRCAASRCQGFAGLRIENRIPYAASRRSGASVGALDRGVDGGTLGPCQVIPNSSGRSAGDVRDHLGVG